jgi:hypothetical protein
MDKQTGETHAGSVEAGDSSSEPFEQAAKSVLSEVQQAFAAMVEALPGPIRTAADVQRAFGVDKKLGWQVYRVATAPNPMAAGTAVPAKVSVRRLAMVARKRGMPPALVSRMEDSILRFEEMVHDHAQDRSEFAAMVAEWTPEGREKGDLERREVMFKSMAQLTGAASELNAVSLLLRPSEDGQKLDCLRVDATLGLRRLRPGVRVGSSTYVASPRHGSIRTLDGADVDSPQGTILPQFSSSPTPKYEVRREKDRTDYWLTGTDIGLRTSVDMASAVVLRSVAERYRTSERQHCSPGYSPDTPTRRTVFDIILHEDVCPGTEPSVIVYETAPRGMARYLDPDRAPDLRDWRPPVKYMGEGVNNFRCPWIPHYVDMLTYACDKLAWDTNSFRGYRIAVEYPVLSWQMMLGFELPEGPGKKLR